MKIRNFFVGAVAALAFIVGCQEKEQNLGTPAISISKSEMTFEVAGGDQELTVTSSRDWKVENDADWVVVSPSSGEASANPQTVTVSVLENTGLDRTADLVFTIGLKKQYLTVNQAGPEGSAEALVVYANDFDISKAQNNNGWPYLDKNYNLWDNKKGTGSETVEYEFGGKMSVRTSGKASNDGSGFSHYAGSGTNKIFFGAATSILKINKITLNGTQTGFALSFGGQKYLQDGDSNFSWDQFKVYVSNDMQKWVELEMAFPADADVNGDWNLASCNFTVPAGTTQLGIAFVSTESSAYSIDDVLLQNGVAGQVIDFSTGVAIDGTSTGGGNTDGGNTGGDNTGSTTAPENAIFFESFTTSQGAFTLNEVTVPSSFSYVWGFDASYKCMKATAYENATSKNYESESWLISPEIDLAGQTAAYLTFEHAGGYFGTPANEATVWVSKDGGDWAQLTIAAADYPTSWSFIPAGHWNLENYLGSKVKFALKYASTATKAGTWEVRNFAVIAGTYEEAPAPEQPDTPEGTTVTIKTTSALTWADDTHSTYGAGLKTTVDGVTIAFYNNSSNTAVSKENQLKSDHIRVYKNYALIITLENGQPLKYLKLNTPGGDYAGIYNVVSGAGTVTKVGNDLIWSGEHASPFIATMDGSQVRVKEMTIVY